MTIMKETSDKVIPKCIIELLHVIRQLKIHDNVLA